MQRKFKFLVRGFPSGPLQQVFIYLFIYVCVYVLLLSGTTSGQTRGWSFSWLLAGRFTYSNRSCSPAQA